MEGNTAGTTLLNWDEVRAGDTLVAVIDDETGKTMTLRPGYCIVAVDLDDELCPYRGHRVDQSSWQAVWLSERGARVFIRTRSGSGEFPHRCPRCGTPAYVGLLRVVHETGVDECPTSA